MGDIYGENMSQDDGGDRDIADHLGIHDTYVDGVILCPKKTPQEHLFAVKASTQKVLGKLKMSHKKSPSRIAPVEFSESAKVQSGACLHQQHV